MRALKLLLATIALVFMPQTSAAQDELPVLTEKDSIVVSSWMFTVGTNIVDDSGDEFGNLFDVGDSWNAVPFPSRISIGRYFKSGLGLEAIGTYNRYKEGKIIDGTVNQEDVDYFALDFRASYDLNKILGETGWFDPYVGVGAGYTDANNQGRGTYNATFGFRTWFSERFGLDFNTSGKWAMSTENATNHIQHAAGVVYQFDIEKGLTRKGQEKLALIQEMEREQQRIQDSIAAAKRAEEEARRLAEELERQREAERLAAEELAKEDDRSTHLNQLQEQVNALGNVHFALNSSYLASEEKILLDALVQILKENEDIGLMVSSHTDSRGTDEYNMWLSERRLARTVDYLIAKGISEGRIQKMAFGEERLTNECDNRTPCSSEKHSKNRRSEFVIQELN